jgi:hypothetical protein
MSKQVIGGRAVDVPDAAGWTAPNGETFANIGSALRAARFGDFGRRPVRLTRSGYSDTVIAPGGPAGWYVRDMGGKL